MERFTIVVGSKDIVSSSARFRSDFLWRLIFVRTFVYGQYNNRNCPDVTSPDNAEQGGLRLHRDRSYSPRRPLNAAMRGASSEIGVAECCPPVSKRCRPTVFAANHHGTFQRPAVQHSQYGIVPYSQRFRAVATTAAPISFGQRRNFDRAGTYSADFLSVLIRLPSPFSMRQCLENLRLYTHRIWET